MTMAASTSMMLTTRYVFRSPIVFGRRTRTKTPNSAPTPVLMPTRPERRLEDDRRETGVESISGVASSVVPAFDGSSAERAPRIAVREVMAALRPSCVLV